MPHPEQDAYEFLLQTVAEGITQARFRPELSDANELAQVLWAGIHGVISIWLNHSVDPWIEWREPRETVRTMIDVLVRGATMRG